MKKSAVNYTEDIKVEFIRAIKLFISEFAIDGDGKIEIDNSNEDNPLEPTIVLIFTNEGTDFDPLINEYVMLTNVYNSEVGKTFDSFEALIRAYNHIDEEVVGLMYLLKNSVKYSVTNESKLTVVFDVDDIPYFVLNMYYLEWGKKHLSISEDDSIELFKTICTKYL